MFSCVCVCVCSMWLTADHWAYRNKLFPSYCHCKSLRVSRASCKFNSVYLSVRSVLRRSCSILECLPVSEHLVSYVFQLYFIYFYVPIQFRASLFRFLFSIWLRLLRIQFSCTLYAKIVSLEIFSTFQVINLYILSHSVTYTVYSWYGCVFDIQWIANHFFCSS